MSKSPKEDADMPFSGGVERYKAVPKVTDADIINFLDKGPRTVWAVLREDTYETSFGDGYYSYVEAVYAAEEDALRFTSEHASEPWIRWHVRCYHLRLERGSPAVSPEPTEAEPTTPATLIAHLLASQPALER